MKFVSPFEPINFWAQGPWVFFNMGLRFMQTWQEECFSRLSLTPVARRSSAPRVELSTDVPCEIQALNAAIAARQGRPVPLLGCLQNTQVVGGPAGEDASHSLKAAKTKTVATPAAVVRPAPAKGAEVPGASVVSSAASAPPMTSVTSMLAMQAKSLAKAVKTAPVVDPKPIAKKVAKAEAASAQPAKAAGAAAPKAKPAVKAVAKSGGSKKA